VSTLALALLSPPAAAVELLFGGDDAAAAVERGRALALGALLTRYLVEAPPNVCTPT
jgi:leucyl aminopeptidase